MNTKNGGGANAAVRAAPLRWTTLGNITGVRQRGNATVSLFNYDPALATQMAEGYAAGNILADRRREEASARRFNTASRAIEADARYYAEVWAPILARIRAAEEREARKIWEREERERQAAEQKAFAERVRQEWELYGPWRIHELTWPATWAKFEQLAKEAGVPRNLRIRMGNLPRNHEFWTGIKAMVANSVNRNVRREFKNAYGYPPPSDKSSASRFFGALVRPFKGLWEQLPSAGAEINAELKKRREEADRAQREAWEAHQAQLAREEEAKRAAAAAALAEIRAQKERNTEAARQAANAAREATRAAAREAAREAERARSLANRRRQKAVRMVKNLAPRWRAAAASSSRRRVIQDANLPAVLKTELLSLLPNDKKLAELINKARRSETPAAIQKLANYASRTVFNKKLTSILSEIQVGKTRLHPLPKSAVLALENSQRKRENKFGIRGFTPATFEANLERTKTRHAAEAVARKADQERAEERSRELYKKMLKMEQLKVQLTLSNLEKTRKNISKLKNNTKIKAVINKPTDEIKALKKELENAEADNAKSAEKFKNLIENPPANAYKSRIYMGTNVNGASRELVQARKRTLEAHAKYFTELAKVAAGGAGPLSKQRWLGVVDKIKTELKAGQERARAAAKLSAFARASPFPGGRFVPPQSKGFVLNALQARKNLNASVYAARKEGAEARAKWAASEANKAQKTANANAKVAANLAIKAERLAQNAKALKSYKPEMSNPSKKSGTEIEANRLAKAAANAATKANQSKQNAAKMAAYAKLEANQAALWSPQKARAEAMKRRPAPAASRPTNASKVRAAPAAPRPTNASKVRAAQRQMNSKTAANAEARAKAVENAKEKLRAKLQKPPRPEEVLVLSGRAGSSSGAVLKSPARSATFRK